MRTLARHSRIRPSSGTAFTLIELLIVVAIIAILAAIAVPNFLEAQTRAKVSRAKSDLRTLDTAITTYAVDYNCYPAAIAGTSADELKALTTPIAYISSVPQDAFKASKVVNDFPYEYVVFRFHPESPLADDSGADPARGGNPPAMCHLMEAPLGVHSNQFGWFVFSIGPDQDEEYSYAGDHPRCLSAKIYDPTNGTVSSGDIFRVGGHQPIF